MHQMEYIKCYWNYIDNETPILIFYEVDIKNDRYTTRNIDIFPDRHIETIGGKEAFVSEAPCPLIKEINQMEEFKAFLITKEEFELLWNNSSNYYKASLEFPEDSPIQK